MEFTSAINIENLVLLRYPGLVLRHACMGGKDLPNLVQNRKPRVHNIEKVKHKTFLSVTLHVLYCRSVAHCCSQVEHVSVANSMLKRKAKIPVYSHY